MLGDNIPRVNTFRANNSFIFRSVPESRPIWHWKPVHIHYASCCGHSDKWSPQAHAHCDRSVQQRRAFLLPVRCELMTRLWS